MIIIFQKSSQNKDAKNHDCIYNVIHNDFENESMQYMVIAFTMYPVI